MGRHRAQDRPPGGVDRPGIAWWDDREDPAASLSAALRGRATLKMHGPERYRLVLHRSAVSRVLTVMALALILLLLSLLGLKALADPFDRDSRGAFWLVVVVLAIPAALRAINLFRRRTVLSASGIELHRLVWTERRPWPAAPSGARRDRSSSASRSVEFRIEIGPARRDLTPRPLAILPGRTTVPPSTPGRPGRPGVVGDRQLPREAPHDRAR